MQSKIKELQSFQRQEQSKRRVSKIAANWVKV